MEILCLSDTHSLEYKIPENLVNINCDVILHAGDICNGGYIYEAKMFLDWFNEIKGPRYKIFCAGNHDWCFQTHPDKVKELLSNYPDIIYLQDEEVIIEGVKFYGSPWQPEFYNWAFNLKRGSELQEKWNMIPKDVDVLITHGPVKDILDFVPYNGGENVGCVDLKETILTLSKLKVHICGHVHFSRGEGFHNKVHYVNASICNERYEPINEPILISI